MPCEFEACTSNPVNGQPASQFILYPIPATSADATTPALQLQQAEAGSTVGGNWPQETFSWFPSGTGSAAAFDWTMLAQPDGTPYSSVRQFTLDASNSFTETQDANGWTLGQVQGGTSFDIRLRELAGAGQLTGSNLKVDPSILPANPYPYTIGAVIATGSNQANAAPITTAYGPVLVAVTSGTTSGARLPPAADAAILILRCTSALTTNGAKIYPASGEHINSLATNASLFLQTNKVIMFVSNGQDRWSTVNLSDTN